MVLLSKASDTDTTIDSGGTFIALSGASVTALNAQSGADIVSGGVVTISGTTGVTVDSSGTTGLVIGSGVSSVVLSGGIEISTTIGNNGSDEVYSGGTAIDTTIAAGGTLTIDAGAAISGPITFSGISATLSTSETGLPGVVISGFTSGDFIALPTLSGSGLSASVESGNVLAVLSGGTALASFQLDPSASYTGSSLSVTTTSSGSVVAFTSGSTAESSGTGIAQSIEIPLYLVPYGSGFKVGIEISFDGGSTYRMYEFDTGASGFFSSYDASAWSSYSPVSESPTTISYDSGNNYMADVVSTNVTFQTTSGTLTADRVNVGLITTASTTGNPQYWNQGVTGTAASPPLDNAFYGDFGMGLGSKNDSIEAVLAQLTGGLSNGFIITLGTAPAVGTGQIGELTVGLTTAEIQSYSTLIPMQGQNTLDTFPNSNQPTYTQDLGSGTMEVSSGGSSYSEPSGFVYDTGAPEMEIHTGTVITSAGLSPFLTSKGEALTSGSTIALSVPGATAADGGWGYGHTVNPDEPGTSVAVGSNGTDGGDVNTGIGAFFGESVMFDLADGVMGFEAIACFAQGTLIQTAAGRIAIEHLADRRYCDHSHRRISADPLDRPANRRLPPASETRDRSAGPHSGACVRPQSAATRPLSVARSRALCQNVFIPVKHLINGDAVGQIDRPRVTYYHLELESHDVVLAEGLPAETYLAPGDRAAFANGGQVIELHPGFAPAPRDAMLRWEALGYAPLIITGPVVERAKLRLVRRQSRNRRRA